MRVAKFARVLALVAPILALGACKGDITEDGAGDPFAFQLTASEVTTTVNGTVTINGQVVDRYRTPLASSVTVTSLDPAVVRVESVEFVGDLAYTKATLKGLAKSTDGVKVVFSHGSLTDTATIKVN